MNDSKIRQIVQKELNNNQGAQNTSNWAAANRERYEAIRRQEEALRRAQQKK